MKSPSTSRVSISGIPDDVLDQFDALADAEDKSRSEKVVELIEEEVGEAIPDGSGEYVPVDEKLQRVYEAAVDAANRSLVLRFDLVGSEVAQSVGIGQKAVRGHLFRLQNRGYVKHLQSGLGDDKKESYRIKPPCANPKMWRYSEVYDPEAVKQLEAAELGDADDQMDDLDAAEEVSQSAD